MGKWMLSCTIWFPISLTNCTKQLRLGPTYGSFRCQSKFPLKRWEIFSLRVMTCTIILEISMSIPLKRVIGCLAGYSSPVSKLWSNNINISSLPTSRPSSSISCTFSVYGHSSCDGCNSREGYLFSTDLTRIDGGVETKLNRLMFKEPELKFCIYGSIPESETIMKIVYF